MYISSPLLPAYLTYPFKKLTGKFEWLIIILVSYMVVFNRGTNERKISYLVISLCCSEFHVR